MTTRIGRATIVTLGLTGAVLAVGVAAATAQTSQTTTTTQTTKAPATSRPGVVRVDTVEVTGTVDAVDVDKRLLTVTGPRRTVTLKVGPDVKNLDQVKPGDKLTLKYLDSVALFVRKANEPAGAAESSAVSVAPKGQKPAAVKVDTVEVTATVEAVDHEKRTLTLKGPEGNVRTIKVDPAVKRLNEVKKGDELVVRHTEGLAVYVKSQ